MKWSLIENEKDIAFLDYAKANHIEDDCTFQSYTLDHILKYYPKDNFRTCIDAGASYGFLSAGFAKHFESVECFEVSPSVFPMLRLNMKNFSNINLYNIALYDKPGLLNFIQEQQSGTSRLLKSYELNKFKNKISVKSRDLDSFKFSNVDLLKIDVEGSESKVLLGARKTIESSRPVIFIEMDLRRGPESDNNRKKIMEYFRSIKYELVDVRFRDFLYIPSEDYL